MKYSINQHLYVTGSGLQFTQDQGLGYRMPLSIPVCRQKALEVSTGSFHCLIHDKPRPQLHPSLVQLHQQPHQPGRSTPNSFLTTHTEWLPGMRLRYMYSVQHIKKILRGWWLPGDRSSVGGALPPQVRGPGFNFWWLPAFHFLLLTGNSLSSFSAEASCSGTLAVLGSVFLSLFVIWVVKVLH